jgi:hypothetical protein
MEQHVVSPDSPALPTVSLDEMAAQLRGDPEALAEFVSLLSPGHVRKDGWTPFARRLFLQVVAETGRVSRACEYVGLSVSSAYALRHRDPVFAAGWDAAAELARTALADALYERALDGTTETITRNGEIVAERHRHDNRLSVAVLHRLDKRCDAARESGARHVRVLEKWDEWLALVGKGAETEAAALLEPVRTETSPDLQLPQLPESANPTSGVEEEDGLDLSDRCWRDRDGVWMTDFPPPPGFDGDESCDYGDPDEPYERECTPEEVAILEADRAAEATAERAEDEALRDAWFQLLKDEAEQMGYPAIVVGHEMPPPEMLQSGDESALTWAQDDSPVDE